jgi:hypothetical protein
MMDIAYKKAIHNSQFIISEFSNVFLRGNGGCNPAPVHPALLVLACFLYYEIPRSGSDARGADHAPRRHWGGMCEGQPV